VSNLGRRAVFVFLAAWALRLLYVAQISHAPYFDVPLVDGVNYFRTAAAVASGNLLGGPRVFWQPPLYPYFIAALLALFGQRMAIIYTVQAAVGSISCVLVYLIGRRLFGERSALAAAAIMILYGPLIYFDAQPLIPVLHVCLVLAGLLLLLRAGNMPSPGARAWLWAGGAWGLAVIATPNILLAAPVAALWARRKAAASRAAVVLFLAGVAAPVALVAARNAAVAGEAVLISSNGGINFYIGNNADYERTIRIRPGGEFERLAQEPGNLGITGAAASSRYFTRRALAFLTGYPRPALRLYCRKLLDLIAGREIPRNQDPYVYRSYSSLLALLLWRFGIAFPFGVVAPLALAGAFLPTNREDGGEAAPAGKGGCCAGRALVLAFAAAYAVSILLFFPTDRYRLPLVPVLALFAGRLLGAPRAAWKRRRVTATLLAGLAIFNLDMGKPSEAYPEEEALSRAYALRVRGRTEEAKAEYAKAIALNPGRIDPYNSLAALAAEDNHWEEAAGRYRELVDLAPDFAEARRSLGQAYAALGRKEDARREWQIAVTLAPGAGLALTDLCMSYYDEGFAVAAEPYCARAAAARPDLPEPHLALGIVARTLRKRDLAEAELATAARLFDGGSPGRQRAEELLRKMRDYDRRHRDD
jgi:tetratricopeptide (TPR) repeat protein